MALRSALILVTAMTVLSPGATLAQDEGPVITANRATETAEALKIREAMAYATELPRGAPQGDYPLVAWCEALIKGHIALGESLQTTDALDLDIIRLGKLEAVDFNTALAAAGARQSPAIKATAQQAATAAAGQWAPLLAQQDVKARSEAFGLFFGLPGRCEHAARRIRENITAAPATLKEVGLDGQAAAPAA